jgi:hypothetical protein
MSEHAHEHAPIRHVKINGSERLWLQQGAAWRICFDTEPEEGEEVGDHFHVIELSLLFSSGEPVPEGEEPILKQIAVGMTPVEALALAAELDARARGQVID